MLLRKIYYALPPSLRFVVRRLRYLPQDVLQKRNGLPPRGLIYTGDRDFVQQGKEWVQFFFQQGLKQEYAFLDIGSGIGRIAIPLSQQLTGRYEGFDAIKKGVDWCQQNIARQHPHFHFTYVPLFNDLYNAKGINAAEYSFPYADDSFEYACAISVFSHLVPEETQNYLQQAARVLKKGGKLTATFFILDEASETSMKGTEFDFTHHMGNYALMDKQVKAANVAYQKDYLYQLISDSGLTVASSIKGFWSSHRGSRSPIEFQDILTLVK